MARKQSPIDGVLLRKLERLMDLLDKVSSVSDLDHNQLQLIVNAANNVNGVNGRRLNELLGPKRAEVLAEIRANYFNRSKSPVGASR